jgi:hypothetical protein
VEYIVGGRAGGFEGWGGIGRERECVREWLFVEQVVYVWRRVD